MDALEKICDWRSSLYEVETDTLLSPLALSHRVAQKMTELKSIGVAERSRIVIMKSNSIDFFICLGAIWKLCSVAIVLSADHAPLEVVGIVNDTQPHFILTDKGLQKTTPDEGTAPLLPDDACLILYTSGSSARPKAVVHSATSLSARLDAIHAAIDPKARQTSFNLLPVHFGHGLIGVCLSALCLDQNLTLSPRISIHNAHLVSAWINKTKATFMSGTPALWRLIISLNEKPDRCLRRVQCASAHSGATLFRKIATWSAAPLWNVYGLTECASWISDYRFQDDGDEKIIGDGRAWQTQFRLGELERSATGKSLLIKTSGLFSYYLGRDPEQSGISNDWLNTEDLAEYGPDASIRLLGRRSRVINRGGVKIAPEEVESALLEHPAVDDAIVFGRVRTDTHHGSDVPIIAALVVARKKIAEGELREFLTDHLSEYKIPTNFRFVDSIPRTQNGKVDHLAVQELWSNASHGN